jgi:hypothetical protein
LSVTSHEVDWGDEVKDIEAVGLGFAMAAIIVIFMWLGTVYFGL